MKKQPQRTDERWHRLDNTANLFPVIPTKHSSNVYRISITLTETVAPELLQQALVKVLPWFAAFRVRLRRGMFWHYLDANTAIPHVREEDDFPCQSIDPHLNDRFLFRVTYFGRRINLEAFHVLSDGTGALQFLQAVCCQYLMLAHPAQFDDEARAMRWFAQNAANTEDSYVQNYTPTKKSTFSIGRGLKLKGEKHMLGRPGVVHAHLPVAGLLEVCRQKNVSISQYLTAAMAWAVYTQQLGCRPPRHPINLFLPVNLRNFFGSTTTLNFFSNVYISLPFKKAGLTFDDVLAEVKAQFAEKVTREAMLEKISYTVGSGYSFFIRMVPLPLKQLVLRILYEQSAKSSTMSFSNVGEMKFPEIFSRYVAGGYVLLSPAAREPFKAAALSCGGVLTLSFTNTLKSMDLPRAVIRRLADEGLNIVVETNGVDYAAM